MNRSSSSRRTHGVGISILRYAPSRFIEPVLGVVTIPILTRVLEPAGYGDFKTLILTVGLARIIAFDWINNAAIRFYRPMENDRRRYFTNLLVGLVIGVGVLCIAWGAGVAMMGPSSSGGASASLPGLLLSFAPWMAVTALAAGLVHNGETVFRAMQRPWAFSVVRAGAALSRHGAGLVCLLLFSRNLAAYLGGWAAGALLVAVWAWMANGGWRQLSFRAISLRTLRMFAVFGAPVTLVLLANTTQTTGIRYVLQYFLGAEATGLFSAAYDLGGVPVIVFQSVVMLGLYPLAIDAYEKEGRIDGIIHDGIRYFFMAAIPVVLLLAVLAEPALTVFAGAKYAVAAPVLMLTCAGTLMVGLSQYFSLWFFVDKHTGRWAVINLVAALSNIVAACLIVPQWGYVAAAVTTVGAQALVLAAAIVWGVRPTRQNMPLSTLGYTALACVPMMLVWYGFYRLADLTPLWHCVLVCVIGGGTYTAVLWWTGELSRERDALVALVRRVRSLNRRDDTEPPDVTE